MMIHGGEIAGCDKDTVRGFFTELATESGISSPRNYLPLNEIWIIHLAHALDDVHCVSRREEDSTPFHPPNRLPTGFRPYICQDEWDLRNEICLLENFPRFEYSQWFYSLYGVLLRNFVICLGCPVLCLAPWENPPFAWSSVYILTVVKAYCIQTHFGVKSVDVVIFTKGDVRFGKTKTKDTVSQSWYFAPIFDSVLTWNGCQNSRVANCQCERLFCSLGSIQVRTNYFLCSFFVTKVCVLILCYENGWIEMHGLLNLFTMKLHEWWLQWISSALQVYPEYIDSFPDKNCAIKVTHLYKVPPKRREESTQI